MNLKLKSRNLKHRKRKNKRPKWSVIKINQDLENTQVSQSRQEARLFREL